MFPETANLNMRPVQRTLTAAHPVDSTFRFPDLIAAPAHPDGKSEPESQRRVPDNGLGVFPGPAFALLFEAALAIVTFSGWQHGRLFH
jgi:hypothetical protein